MRRPSYVRLKMDDDKIRDIRFEGQGCAISTASASLMTEAVKGRTRAEALQLFDRVHQLLTDDAAPPADELGKLAALSGVREYPARVKCASLCWHTLASALRSADPKTLPAVPPNERLSDAYIRKRTHRRAARGQGSRHSRRRRGQSQTRLGGLHYAGLGGSFTVYIDGNLFRIAGQDADAIGKTAATAPEVSFDS